MDEPKLETTVVGIVLHEPEEDLGSGYVDLKFRLLAGDDELPTVVAEVRVFLINEDRSISLGELTKSAISRALDSLSLLVQHGQATDRSAPDASNHPEWFR